MKKISLVFVTILALVLFGCSNSANSGSDSNSNNTNPSGVTFSEGWYKYTVSVQGTTQNYYLKYDSNKNLVRAGNDTVEFTGTVFNNYKNNDGFSFDTLSQASNEASFRKITESELPSWATNTNNTNNEETYLSAACSFLQNFASGTNNQSDTITFSNVNSTIRRDINNEPYITCNISATCNNQNAKYLFNTTNTYVNFANVRIYYKYAAQYSSNEYYLDFSNSKNKEEVIDTVTYNYMEYMEGIDADIIIGKMTSANSGTGYHYTK